MYTVMHQIHDRFGDVFTFLHGSGLPPATTDKLLAILEDPPKCRKLKMELSMTSECHGAICESDIHT